VVFGPAWAKEGTYDPIIDPADFVGGIDNPYMPLMPGTIFVYEGETEDGIETNEVYVTHQTKEILGVTCIVVWDRVWLDGELIEETYDWYAQDKDGNVWYFGEDSKEYEGGVVVSTEGSWEAGVDGAEPGIVMKANPQVGDSYRQEYYEGEAEDMAEVLSLTESVSVGYGDFDNCLMTKEWTALDPGVVEHKYYAAGVGEVLVVMVEGGTDRAELKDKRYDPIIDPADFVGGIDNPYMPLMPGPIFVYEGETEDGIETNEVYVTHQTKEILGVTCIVVWDRVWLDGELTEETYDWYAQDKDGNVWYFGEDSNEYEGGVVVSTEGSWEAGVAGDRDESESADWRFVPAGVLRRRSRRYGGGAQPH
jgi:hypothetical protein